MTHSRACRAGRMTKSPHPSFGHPLPFRTGEGMGRDLRAPSPIGWERDGVRVPKNEISRVEALNIQIDKGCDEGSVNIRQNRNLWSAVAERVCERRHRFGSTGTRAFVAKAASPFHSAAALHKSPAERGFCRMYTAETCWELQKFLIVALKANPNILD